MIILRKILITVLALGILAGLFILGIAFFAAALILLPIVYIYQRYKMNNLWGKVAEAKKAQAANEEKIMDSDGATIIEAEFEEIEKDKV